MVAFERADVLEGRRQANEIIIEPPQECSRVGGSGKTESLFLQLGEQEGIDRRLHATGRAHFGRPHPLERLISPVLSRGLKGLAGSSESQRGSQNQKDEERAE